MAIPNPTVRTGQLATNDVLTNQQRIDMGTRVFQYDPPGSPGMKIFTTRMGSKPANNTTIRWMEDTPIPYWATLNGGINNSVTSITVATGYGTYFRPGNLVKVITSNEVMRVINVNVDVLTVTRGYIGSAASASNGDYLLNLSTAEMEGDVAPEARMTVKVEKTNFTQIRKDTVHLTGTHMAVDTYHGDERTYQQRKVGEAHSRRWEEIAFHGRKNEDTSTGAKPIRTAGGIIELISTNVLAAGGALAEADFRAWLGDSFRYTVSEGRRSKLLFCGRPLINTINSWGLSKLILNETASQTYGMDISTYEAGFGRVQVIFHPLFEYGFSGYGVLVDPDGVMFRPLKGRGTHLELNVQDPAEDAVKDQYLTEATFQFALEAVHGYTSGVTW